MNNKGVDAIRTVIQELEREGYIARHRERKDNGQLGGMVYVIREVPPEGFVADAPQKPQKTQDTAPSASASYKTPSAPSVPSEPHKTPSAPIVLHNTPPSPSIPPCPSTPPYPSAPSSALIPDISSQTTTATATETTVSETPTLEKPTLDNPALEKPMLAKPTLEKPTLENPTLLSKELRSKELRNKDKLNKESCLVLSSARDYENKKTDEIRREVKEQVDYENLKADNPDKLKLADGFLEVIVEVIASKKEYWLVSGEKIPTETLKHRYKQIGNGHIKTLIEQIGVVRNSIRDMKAYMVRCLYNAPVTADTRKENYAAVNTAVNKDSSHTPRKKNGFCNFTSNHKFDWEEIERLENIFIDKQIERIRKEEADALKRNAEEIKSSP